MRWTILRNCPILPHSSLFWKWDHFMLLSKIFLFLFSMTSFLISQSVEKFKIRWIITYFSSWNDGFTCDNIFFSKWVKLIFHDIFVNQSYNLTVFYRFSLSIATVKESPSQFLEHSLLSGNHGVPSCPPVPSCPHLPYFDHFERLPL